MNLTFLSSDLLTSLPLSASSYFVLMTTCKLFRNIYQKMLPPREKILVDAIKFDNIEFYLFIENVLGFKYGKLCQKAARHGSFNLLKWSKYNNYAWNQNVCTSAAKGGHLEILKWLRDNGCRWNQSVSYAAIRNGHLDIFKWIHSNGCPWNLSLYHLCVRKLPLEWGIWNY